VPVVGYCRNQEKADALARRTGGRSLRLDLASPDSIRSACRELEAGEGTLAGVVLAGSPPPSVAPFGRISGEDLTHQFQVNVAGPQALLAELVRTHFRKARTGTVVGILTRAMGDGIGSASAGMGAYVVGKYAMKGLLAALAADYPWVRVRSVSPGFTETPMLEAFDARFLDLQRARSPFATPREVAASVMEALFEDER
jgi:3-oxoacyl-[acyl-carrier protein] reductase